jgi:hypothetical protein
LKRNSFLNIHSNLRSFQDYLFKINYDKTFNSGFNDNSDSFYMLIKKLNLFLKTFLIKRSFLLLFTNESNDWITYSFNLIFNWHEKWNTGFWINKFIIIFLNFNLSLDTSELKC